VPFLAPDNVSGTIINQLNNGCMSHSLVADLDGDGADELLIKHFINDDDQRSEYDGIKFQITPSGGMNAFAIQTGVHVEPREGVYGFALDANGDGLTDVAVHEHDALFIYINSGSARDAHRFSDGLIFFLSFNGQPIVTRLRSPSGLALAVGPVIDEDGDGRDDIIVYPVDPDPSHPRPNAGVLRAHSLLNNSSTDFPRFVDNFEYHELSGIPSNPDFARSVAMDMNGDGIKDLVTRLDFDKAPGDFHSFVRTGTSLPKLTKIQDGLGSKKSIFYANLTSSIYTPGAAACSYPERCAHPRHQAIDSVLTEDNMALSNLRAFVYHYSGAGTGLRGRGWLGFASVGMEELAHGFKETTFYDQSRFTLATEPTRTIYPFLGIPKRHVSFIDLGSDRQMMLDRVMQPAVLHNSGELHLIPYVGQVTASTHDLVGATQDLSLGTVQRTMTPDKFGNAKSETVTSFARGGATVDTLRTDNKYVYEDTPQYVDAWLVGALRRQTTTDTTPNGTDSHTLVYEYDPLRPGLVASGTLEPDRSQYKLVTSYLDRDRFGNVQKIEGKGGDEVRTDLLAWDDRGVFPTSMTDAEGYVTTRVFDTALGAAVETDQRGAGVARTLVSLAVPDGFGRVRTLSGPDGVETTLDYSAAVVSGTTPIRLRVAMLRAGQTSVTEYDPAGRPTQSQTNTLNGALLTGKMSYDVFGRLESASRPSMSGAGPATTYSYDNADRLVASTTPDTATWERCYGGLTSCVRDPRGHTSCRTTDVIGRATFESDPNDDPTESCQTVADRIESAPASFPGAHYVFGPFGALKEIATTNGGRSITPDAFGRPVAQSDQTSGTREFVYDPFGQLTDVADDNQNEAHFSHDKIGRMISRLDRGGVTPDPSGVLTQWVWRRDLQGRLDRTTTPETTAVFDYDEFGRTNTISRMIDGEPFTAHVDERGAAGRPTIISYPAGTGAGSLRVRNVYDIAGTLIEVKNADDANVSYWKLTDVNSFGQVKTESFPNGLTTSRAYDGTVGRPQSITTGSLQNETYLYYLHGSLKEYNDITNSQDLTYKYDRYDRLTSSSTASTTVESFDYDLVGNLKLNSGRTYEYKNPAHSQWLTDISSPSGSSTLGYDNVGNVKTRSGDLLSNFTIDYTPSNRPKTLTLANGGGSVSYTYDADQVRVQKKGGATTRTYFDGFYYRTDDGSHPVHVFLIGNGARIVAAGVRTETDTGLDEKTYFLHDDVLGSIKVVSNATGQPAQEQRFGAFGPITTTGDPTSIFGYTSHEEEAELGLINMRARMYDPVVGRFLQPDPIVSLGNSQQSNPYAYVLNNPLRYTDPFGLANCEGCSGSGRQTIFGSLLGSGGPNEHGLLAATRLTVIQAPSNGSSSIQAHPGLTFDQKLNFALWGMAASRMRFGHGGTGSLLPNWIPTDAGSTWAPAGGSSAIALDVPLDDFSRMMVCQNGLATL